MGHSHKLSKILIDTSGRQLTAHIGKLETPECAYATGIVEGNALLVLDVWVPPGMRRQGLGRRLVKRLEKEAGTGQTLTSKVAPGESARGFWSALDIKEAPERDDWWKE